MAVSEIRRAFELGGMVKAAAVFSRSEHQSPSKRWRMGGQKEDHPMRKLIVSGAFAVLFAVAPVSAQAAPGDATPENPDRGAKGMQNIEPGKVGPGSEKNSTVSPTSPTVPMNAQPPPEIPSNSGASGSSSGEQGKSAPSNPAPGNPSSSGAH